MDAVAILKGSVVKLPHDLIDLLDKPAQQAFECTREALDRTSGLDATSHSPAAISQMRSTKRATPTRQLQPTPRSGPSI